MKITRLISDNHESSNIIIDMPTGVHMNFRLENGSVSVDKKGEIGYGWLDWRNAKYATNGSLNFAWGARGEFRLYDKFHPYCTVLTKKSQLDMINLFDDKGVMCATINKEGQVSVEPGHEKDVELAGYSRKTETELKSSLLSRVKDGSNEGLRPHHLKGIEKNKE